MKFPEKCPACGAQWDGFEPRNHLIQRTQLDWDCDEPDRIEDQVCECSKCHTLFRLRWTLTSFHKLLEISTGCHDVGEFYREDVK